MMSNFEHLYHNLFSIEIFYSVQGNPCCAGSYWNEERSICESKKTFILVNMYKEFIFLQQNQKIDRNEWLCFFYQNVLLVTKEWIAPNAALSQAMEKIVKVLATVI